MGSTAYEKVELDLMHPGKPILTCPLCLHLLGQTQLVGSTWSRPVFKEPGWMASLFPGPNFKDSVMEDPQSWVL